MYLEIHNYLSVVYLVFFLLCFRPRTDPLWALVMIPLNCPDSFAFFLSKELFNITVPLTSTCKQRVLP